MTSLACSGIRNIHQYETWDNTWPVTMLPRHLTQAAIRQWTLASSSLCRVGAWSSPRPGLGNTQIATNGPSQAQIGGEGTATGKHLIRGCFRSNIIPDPIANGRQRGMLSRGVGLDSGDLSRSALSCPTS